MKEKKISLILIHLFAITILFSGCMGIPSVPISMDQIEAIPVVSNQLDQSDAWLDSEIASTKAKIEALQQASVSVPVDETDPDPVPDAPAAGDVPPGTIFLHGNVTDWPITATLAVSIGGGKIRLDYDKSNVWPVANIEGGTVGNPWVLVEHPRKSGQFYAATWEYLRKGQIEKPMSCLDGSNGDHIKKSPLSSWRPVSGEMLGWMVSSHARTAIRTVNERTPVVWRAWP